MGCLTILGVLVDTGVKAEPAGSEIGEVTAAVVDRIL